MTLSNNQITPETSQLKKKKPAEKSQLTAAVRPGQQCRKLGVPYRRSTDKRQRKTWRFHSVWPSVSLASHALARYMQHQQKFPVQFCYILINLLVLNASDKRKIFISVWRILTYNHHYKINPHENMRNSFNKRPRARYVESSDKLHRSKLYLWFDHLCNNYIYTYSV